MPFDPGDPENDKTETDWLLEHIHSAHCQGPQFGAETDHHELCDAVTALVHSDRWERERRVEAVDLLKEVAKPEFDQARSAFTSGLAAGWLLKYGFATTEVIAGAE